MGLEVLKEVFSTLANTFAVFSGGSFAKALAWAGIILIAIVALYYLAIALVGLVRAFLNMKVKYLGILLLLTGLILIAIAIAIPTL